MKYFLPFLLVGLAAVDLSAQQLRYATFFGGSRVHNFRSARADDGSVVLAGVSQGLDFPFTPATLRSPWQFPQLFVSKIDVSRSGAQALVYSSVLVQEHSVELAAVEAVGGLVYIAGTTGARQYPTTENAFQREMGRELNTPEREAFLTVIDPTRSGADALVYSTFLGGERGESALGLHVDEQGRVVVWGKTRSASFPVTPDAYLVEAGPASSGDHYWIARIDPNLPGAASLSYATFAPSMDITDLAVDDQGRFHLLGWTGGRRDKPASTANALRADCDAPDGDACGERYYALLDPAMAGADALRYGTYFGPLDGLARMALDSQSRPWIGTSIGDADFPVNVSVPGLGCAGRSPNCGRARRDAIFLHLDPERDGPASLLWSARVGGSDAESIDSIAPDGAGGLYATGRSDSEDFPATDDLYRQCPSPTLLCLDPSIFLLHLDPTLQGVAALDYAVELRGEHRSLVLSPGIAVSHDGAALFSGSGGPQDFLTSPNAFDAENSISGGPFADIRQFLVKFDPSAPEGERLRLSTFWSSGTGIVPDAPSIGPDGLVLIASEIDRADAPTTVDAYDRTCALGNVDHRGGCGRNAYVALVAPEDGTPVDVDPSPIAVDYAIPDPAPESTPRSLSGPPGVLWTASARSDGDWLDVTPDSLAGGEFRAVIRPGALVWGEHRGRILLRSEDPVIRRDVEVVLTVGGPPPGEIAGVLNAASFLPGPVAPGQIVSIFGVGLGPSVGLGPVIEQGIVGNPNGVSVSWERRASPLLFVSHGQINAIVPYPIEGESEVTLRISTAQGVLEQVGIPAAPTAPGLFTATGSGTGPAAALSENNRLNTPTNPARTGQALTLFGTGEGQTIPPGFTGSLSMRIAEVAAPVEATVGGLPAEILFAGPAPGFAGLLQVNVRVPQGLAPGEHPVVVTIGGRSSQPGVTVSVD